MNEIRISFSITLIIILFFLQNTKHKNISIHSFSTTQVSENLYFLFLYVNVFKNSSDLYKTQQSFCFKFKFDKKNNGSNDIFLMYSTFVQRMIVQMKTYI